MIEKLTTYEIPVGYNVSIFTGDLVTLNAPVANVNQIAIYLPILNQANAAPNVFDNTRPVLGVFQGCEYYDATTKVLTFSKWYPANTQVVPGTKISALINDDPNVVWEIQVSTYINANGTTFAGGNVSGTSAGPFFPGISGTAGYVSGIGSNYSIMGGGGIFNTIPNPAGGFYTNNPISTFTDTAANTPVTVSGTNPFGGSTLNGTSGAYLCVSTYGTNTGGNTLTGNGAFAATRDYDHTAATLPLKALGYSPNSQNIPAPGKTLDQTPFVNVMVIINNHVFKGGTVGPTFTA